MRSLSAGLGFLVLVRLGLLLEPSHEPLVQDMGRFGSQVLRGVNEVATHQQCE
jgi:hypothetical protein